MADAIVSFAVERLGDLLISETKLLYGVSDQINEIRRELKRMQNFLKEADKKQIQDERVRGRVVEIKEVAFRTEDAIEIFALQGATNSGFKEALRRFACISSQLISRHKVVTEINDTKAKLANIHQSLTTYGITKGLEEGETSNSQVNFKTRRISLPYDVEKDFIGMEKEIEEPVSSLEKDFRKQVLKEILQQLLPDDREGEVLNTEVVKLVDKLRKFQKKKKCLIVIDDIWTADSWVLLEPAFSFPLGDTTKGCKILLTTRHLAVAELGSVFKIPGLTEDEGWQLLSKKARIYDQPGY
ncbi:hypothetical protein POM88_053420 [Heracleum sosnowskyi]|uniref:NB-ARC domain-containing protein n=1 Tax=Heracleum sosnowskyi TaxID=360622 RepID=A0AAD8GQY2_9APIA|nr:hypothetical protein POM88_053420 [Heracleum sosnowskyi]